MVRDECGALARECTAQGRGSIMSAGARGRPIGRADGGAGGYIIHLEFDLLIYTVRSDLLIVLLLFIN